MELAKNLVRHLDDDLYLLLWWASLYWCLNILGLTPKWRSKFFMALNYKPVENILILELFLLLPFPRNFGTTILTSWIRTIYLLFISIALYLCFTGMVLVFLKILFIDATWDTVLIRQWLRENTPEKYYNTNKMILSQLIHLL